MKMKAQKEKSLGRASGGFAAAAIKQDRLLSARDAITILKRAQDWSRDIQAVMASGSLTATKALISAELLAEVLADAQTTARRLGPANAYTAQLNALISAGQGALGMLRRREQTVEARETEEISSLRAENVALKADNEGLRRLAVGRVNGNT